jgi:hypothetical protein
LPVKRNPVPAASEFSSASRPSSDKWIVPPSHATPARRPEASDEPRGRAAEPSSAWTIPLLCAGVAVIACCFIIPAADENRRLVYERERLKIDLEHIERQVAVNGEFLKHVADDPALLERLAQRQMKMVREGTSVLELRDRAVPASQRQSPQNQNMSPYPLLTVAPPDPLPEYDPLGGRFADLCRHPRSRLILMGSALMLIASGLVLGYTARLR